jgi:hypothetical protein
LKKPRQTNRMEAGLSDWARATFKACVTVMWSTGTNARYSNQHRDYRGYLHQ